MITWIRHWYILRKAGRQYKTLVKAKNPSFEETFKQRVSYLVHMLQLQFSGEISVSHQAGKATVVKDGLVLMELTVFYINASIHVVARTNIKPLPAWWLHTSFTGIKWRVTRFPVMKQLTYVKPHEP